MNTPRTDLRPLAGRAFRTLALCLGWLLAAPLAMAQNRIEAVTATRQDGQETVQVDFAQVPEALPGGFVLQTPARIVLDLPRLSNATGRSNFDFGLGNLQSASLVQAGDQVRLVLNLKQASSYRTRLVGRSLLVLLGTPGSVGGAATDPETAERKATQPIKDLDFRLGPDGAGRIVVSLPSDQVAVEVRQQGQALVADFLQSSLPEGLRRRLDVTDFATPVQTITLSQVGDRVRLLIEPKGQWLHSAYQSDREFVVDLRAVRADTAKAGTETAFNGKKLSLNFQNIDVRALLQVIADFSNFNVVASDSVAGAVTLRLQDVPWDQALDIILQAKSLGMRKTGNVLWIAPREEISAREKLELEASAALQSLEPLRTQSFQMNYTKAAEVAAQLTGSGAAAGVAVSRLLSPRGSAISEARTNQLFVTDVAAKLEQVQQLVTKLDIPVRQVLIEARIVEASDTFGKSLGVRLGGSD